MDNAYIVDGVIAVVLLVGALVGAKRGLFKSLMGMIVVAAALVGAVILANVLAEPVTDMIAPKVENAIVKQFTDKVEDLSDSGKSAVDAGTRDELASLLEEYGIPSDTVNKLIGSVSGMASDAVKDATEAAKDAAADSFRSAVSTTIRAVVYGTVHTVLILVLYIVLLIVLKLLTNLVDHVFDLPVLSTVNGLGGAALGLVETILLVYVVVHVLYHMGVSIIADHANDTFLLRFFLNVSPIAWLTSLMGKT